MMSWGQLGLVICRPGVPTGRWDFSMGFVARWSVLAATAFCVLSAEDGLILSGSTTKFLAWESRLATQRDPSLQPGFSRLCLPVATGEWGGTDLRLRYSDRAAPAVLPGEVPATGGVQTMLEAEWNTVYPSVFIALHPQLVWNSADTAALRSQAFAPPAQDQDAFQAMSRSIIGVHGLGQVLAISTEPVQWGEGIFGGLALGKAGEGFAHLMLTNERGWMLAEPCDEPVFLRYEFFGGVLADNDLAEGPRLVGGRVGLRWGILGAAYSATERIDPGIANNNHDLKQVASLSLGLTGTFELRGEFGLGEAFTVTGNERRQDWLCTLDWIDVTGDQNWRIAAEWYRSPEEIGAGFGDGRWYQGQPLGHLDGPACQSLRALVQHFDLEDEWNLAVIGLWRRRDDPAGHNAWDEAGASIRLDIPLSKPFVCGLEGGLSHHWNPDFVAKMQEWSISIGMWTGVRW